MGKIKKFVNKKFSGDVIHFGGGNFPIVGGVLEMDENAANRWNGEIKAFGFVEIESDAEIAKEQPQPQINDAHEGAE